MTFALTQSLGMGISQDGNVSRTAAGGQAESLGVCAGWQIQQVDDQPITAHDKLASLKSIIETAKRKGNASVDVLFVAPGEVAIPQSYTTSSEAHARSRHPGVLRRSCQS